MKKTKEMQQLGTVLSSLQPDWERVVERSRAHPVYDPDQAWDLSHYARHFSLIHLDLSLEILKGLTLDPVEEGAETSHYVFSYTSVGRLLGQFTDAYDKAGKRTLYTMRGERVGEDILYDKVVLVGDDPLLIDVRLRDWGDATEENKLPGLLKEENYAGRLAPLQEVFQGDVGYGVIIPRNIYRRKFSPIPKNRIAQDFLRQGGLVDSPAIIFKNFLTHNIR